jgi:hypothetical protein
MRYTLSILSIRKSINRTGFEGLESCALTERFHILLRSPRVVIVAPRGRCVACEPIYLLSATFKLICEDSAEHTYADRQLFKRIASLITDEITTSKSSSTQPDESGYQLQISAV